ncbi:hypothetical protein [Anaerorhabdus sp.]|uniref:hypothetical protein n=1 Tax=Anaerorhabdus sp. TaxID=1872524 RepID=UPI002B206B80|nr:hypothetical protein [Anaerorhabdus sp.]MEA4876012.1 hypothetical protein [Anaerorhabdus sp.]
MKYMHTISCGDGRNIAVGDVLDIKTDSKSYLGRVVSISFTATHEPIGLCLDCSKEFYSNEVTVYFRCIKSFRHKVIRQFDEDNK